MLQQYGSSLQGPSHLAELWAAVLCICQAVQKQNVSRRGSVQECLKQAQTWGAAVRMGQEGVREESAEPVAEVVHGDEWEAKREDRQRHIPRYHSRRSPVLGTRGMVASSQSLASEVCKTCRKMVDHALERWQACRLAEAYCRSVCRWVSRFCRHALTSEPASGKVSIAKGLGHISGIAAWVQTLLQKYSTLNSLFCFGIAEAPGTVWLADCSERDTVCKSSTLCYKTYTLTDRICKEEPTRLNRLQDSLRCSDPHIV